MDPETPRRVHVYVSGRVQGVWFRSSTEQEARRRGLGGWVRNLPDGRVEIVAEGPGSAVEALLAWARRGPPVARVEDVQVVEEATTGAPGTFEVRPTPR